MSISVYGIPMYTILYMLRQGRVSNQSIVSVWEANNFATSPCQPPPNSTELASRVRKQWLKRSWSGLLLLGRNGNWWMISLETLVESTWQDGYQLYGNWMHYKVSRKQIFGKLATARKTLGNVMIWWHALCKLLELQNCMLQPCLNQNSRRNMNDVPF